ncbi:MAG TPA: protein kinase, partial [Planctomycetota bacterium]|nr:protein kinase [Planctomycetota bacterium]
MDQLDSSFADLVLEKGLASREQIDECIEIVDKAKQIGAASTLPDTMVAKGYLAANQRDALLATIKRGDSKTTSIGGYELVEKLGRGGMGVVYKARQTAMDRIVALKLLKPSLSRNDVFVERFFREARTAAKLNHPHIVLA